MAKATAQKMTVYSYAKRLGVSETAVMKAVEAEKIVKGYDKQTKRITVLVADAEWGFRHLKIEAAPATAPTETDNEPVTPASSIVIHSGLSRQEAERTREIIAAAIERNKLLEQEGVLVRREFVDSQLFEIGNQLKKALEVVGQRVIANVLAAPDPVTAQAYIDNEIKAVLTVFAKDRLIPDKK